MPLAAAPAPLAVRPRPRRNNPKLLDLAAPRRLAAATRTSVPHQLHLGYEALARGAWEQARASFDAALAQGRSAEAWEGRSWAAWWVDDVQRCLDARERAYRMYRSAGDLRGAARMALWIGDDHLEFLGAAPIAHGWFQRAERILERLEPCPEHGWLDAFRAQRALRRDPVAAEALGARARELGAALGDVDLELLGLATEGLALVNQGDVVEGMQCLEEAATAALRGEFEQLAAAGLGLLLPDLRVRARSRLRRRRPLVPRGGGSSAATCACGSSTGPAARTTRGCSHGTASGTSPSASWCRRSRTCPRRGRSGARRRSCASPCCAVARGASTRHGTCSPRPRATRSPTSDSPTCASRRARPPRCTRTSSGCSASCRPRTRPRARRRWSSRRERSRHSAGPRRRRPASRISRRSPTPCRACRCAPARASRRASPPRPRARRGGPPPPRGRGRALRRERGAVRDRARAAGAGRRARRHGPPGQDAAREAATALRGCDELGAAGQSAQARALLERLRGARLGQRAAAAR